MKSIMERWRCEYANSGTDPFTNYQNEPYAGVTADPDGDGLNNLQEYLGGSDPNNISFITTFPNDHVTGASVNGTVMSLFRNVLGSFHWAG